MSTPFLDACRRKSVDYTPVWFMRQAGRYLPSYRRIRKGKGILDIAKDPELAARLAAEPVRKLGVDAAILFADIMLPMEGIGVRFRIKENIGPVIANPLRSAADVDRLGDFDPEVHVPFVLETIQRTVKKLHGIPLIGFAGAPFTLASYLIEGSPSREFALTKHLMFEQPEVWHSLMQKLTDVVVRYLKAQIDSGADAVQLFDSWVGCLSPTDYRSFVQKYTLQTFRALPERIPTIHFCANSSGLVECFAETGCDVISVDWRIPIDEVWTRSGDRHAVQGNLDPSAAAAGGDLMKKRVAEVLERTSGRKGHVFNLGHGVQKDTLPENLRQIVRMVHERTRGPR